MNKSTVAKKIVEWYSAHYRSLPWRETKDPYKIWLSEIILQQTRVAQGLPYYLKFVNQFPDVMTLARAREQDVLRLWQGLGYYTRARNLHRCAKIVASQFQGEFPKTYLALKALPGVGDYTAAAIASIAYQEKVAVVDGNVYRVLSRVFGIELETNSRQGKECFKQKATELISAERPDIFNQAIMEFGALNCLPRNPKCEECILKKQCVAFARDWQDRLPFKNRKPKNRVRYFNYFVLRQNKKWLMKKRESKDIWQGLFDFYLVETKKPLKPEEIVERDPFLKKLLGKVRFNQATIQHKHVLSHQTLWTCFIPVNLERTVSTSNAIKSEKLKFYSDKEMEKLPKPVLVSRYLQE